MNVKPGMLAILTKSGSGNVGKVVEVISPLGIAPFYKGYYWNNNDGFCWLVRFPRRAKALLGGESYLECPCPDAWLRPVSGLPDEQHTEEHNKQEA